MNHKNLSVTSVFYVFSVFSVVNQQEFWKKSKK
jgi:hypothetical protein